MGLGALTVERLGAQVQHELAKRRLLPSKPLPPRGADAARHLTTIFRPPLPIAEQLVLGDTLPAAPATFVYPPSTLHATVRNLDHISPHADDETIVRAAAHIIEQFRPFEVTTGRLSLSATTLFAEVASTDGTLAELRSRLDHLYPERRMHPLLARRAVAAINLARFGGRLPKEVVDAFDRFTARRFSAVWAVYDIEIVRTDRYLSKEGTTILHRVTLGSRRG